MIRRGWAYWLVYHLVVWPLAMGGYLLMSAASWVDETNLS